MSVPEGIRADVWAALRAARLWHDASDTDIEWLARCAEIREYRRGDLVFREGETAEHIGVVVEGHMRSVHTEDGRTTSLETFWPGEAAGAVSAFSGSPFATNLEAAEALTLALVPAGVVKELIVTEPTIALSVINEISRRWVAAVTVNKRNCVDVVSRVSLYLSELPKTKLGGNAYAVEIPVSRAELAAELSTTPETLSRAFHTLQEQGLVESHDRMIIVPDGDSLLVRKQDSDAVDELVR